jgi:hypothetical protein
MSDAKAAVAPAMPNAPIDFNALHDNAAAGLTGDDMLKDALLKPVQMTKVEAAAAEAEAKAAAKAEESAKAAAKPSAKPATPPAPASSSDG